MFQRVGHMAKGRSLCPTVPLQSTTIADGGPDARAACPARDDARPERMERGSIAAFYSAHAAILQNNRPSSTRAITRIESWATWFLQQSFITARSTKYSPPTWRAVKTRPAIIGAIPHRPTRRRFSWRDRTHAHRRGVCRPGRAQLRLLAGGVSGVRSRRWSIMHSSIKYRF